jgi:hypothetical protein
VPAKLGLQFSKADIFPTITISNYLRPRQRPQYQLQGEHFRYLGPDDADPRTPHPSLRRRDNHPRADSTAWGNIYGANLGFTGVYTAGSNSGPLASNSGSAYADFLLGYARNWDATVSPEYGGRAKNPGVFIQDDFKVTPKLTLNLRLALGREYGVVRSQRQRPVVGPQCNQPRDEQTWRDVVRRTAANGRTSLQKPVWRKLDAEIRFRYQLGTKTDVRGGIGLYTFPGMWTRTAAAWGRHSPAMAT